MSESGSAKALHEVISHDRAILLFESSEEDPWHISEMRDLAATAGVEIMGEFYSRIRRRLNQPFISKDRLRDLYDDAAEKGANSVLVGHDLTPSEQAEMQDAVDVRVLDRTQLILDIFAQRAHTREGKLQVELAQLTYLLPRLAGYGKDLSRLGGGVGTRGPGETKLETDRRRLRKRIDNLNGEIELVRKHREIARSARQKLPFPTVALVGYTSAGKSTLLNALCGSDVQTDAKLFSTLDPTTRRVVLPDGWGVLMTDTVGFIRNLPHLLVASFRSTLEEVENADVLVHVVDSSHERMDEQIKAVNETLAEIDVHDKPTVMVYNKSDLCHDTYDLRRRVADEPYACYISASKPEGLQYLIEQISRALRSLLTHVEAIIPYNRSDLVSACYDYGRVLKADYEKDGIHLSADISNAFVGNLAVFLKKNE